MSVYFDKSKQRWRFSFNRKVGNKRARSTKLLPKGWSRHQAEQYDRTHGASLYAQATGLEKPRLPLSGAVALYLGHRIPQLKDGKHCAQELAKLVDLIETAYLDQTAEIAHQYELDNTGRLKPATIRNRLAYLKAAVRYAYRKHGYGDRDYSDRIVMPTVRNARQIYAKSDELTKLWNALTDPQARAVFRLAFYCGPRWRTSLLTRTQEHVIRQGDDVWLDLGATKNGTPRMKWVHPSVRSDLDFIPFTMPDRTLYAHWKQATLKIGRPDLRPHDLRHSLASYIISTGGTLADVGVALDHESVQASKRYSHLYPERMKAIFQGLPVQQNAHQAGKRKKKAA